MKMLKIEVGANHDASGGGQEPYCWDLIIWTEQLVEMGTLARVCLDMEYSPVVRGLDDARSRFRHIK